METIAQMLERRGHDKGVKEGAKGILLRALKVRFGEVSAAVRERVEAAEEAELQVWVDRLFTAGSVEALLDG